MKLIFTCGDVNGIGPEITVKTINSIKQRNTDKIFVACPHKVFIDALEGIDLQFRFEIVKNISKASENDELVSVIDIGKIKQNPGKPSVQSGRSALKSIRTAADLLKKGEVDAMLTAPISKKAIKMAGSKFPGHTEMLASKFKAEDFVMMFLSNAFKTGLVTIHEPIKRVPALIKKTMLKKKIQIVLKSLKNDFGIEEPRIAVLGLNPHAGEEGLLGKEEINVIEPVIEQFDEGVKGPFPADAFFARQLYQDYDFTLGMYHDQVLAPFKMASKGRGVNYTAGLPIVRTSPDHGTAFDIAGKLVADSTSLYEAYRFAKQIIKNRRKFNENG